MQLGDLGGGGQSVTANIVLNSKIWSDRKTGMQYYTFE